MSQYAFDPIKPVVETKYGQLRGIRYGDVDMFMGVKYADAKRFQRPVEPEPWEGVKNAYVYGPISPQMGDPSPFPMYRGLLLLQKEGEDCQNLNIWAPADKGDGKKPVFVWIHGGGFMAGNAMEEYSFDGFNLCGADRFEWRGCQGHFFIEDLFGFDCRVVEDGRLPDGLARPDILFAVGWHSRVVRAAVERADWRGVPKVCCFDMPWRWSARCIAARFVLRGFLRRYSAAYVPGRVAARYARWLGFPRVEEGLFSIGMDRFAAAPKSAERRGFLYVGRYSPEKRVDLVEQAYARYRELGGAWELDCYGQGGRFAAPGEMPSIYAVHACLLLASAFDPWPLVALEARTSGCEVIMSDRCGNRFELPGVRVVRYGDEDAMAEEMLRVELDRKRRRLRQERGVSDDAEYTCEDIEMYDCGAWVGRTLRLAEELTGEKEAE